MKEISVSQAGKAASRNRARNSKRPDFVCVDGEGQGDNENHAYILLGVGDAYRTYKPDIQWWEAFTFLYETYRQNPNAAYTGFFLSYDFTRWLRTLPESRARLLFLPEGIAKRKRTAAEHLPPFPVECRDPTGQIWQFDILGSKRLALRPKSCHCELSWCKCDGKQTWLYICDTGPFFQTSLMNVINPLSWEVPIITDEEYSQLDQGKKRRSTARLDRQMIEYNRLENQVLARVLRQLDDGMRQIGVRLNRKQWFGPGQAAQAWLKTQSSVPKAKELREFVPSWFMRAAQHSYYGGWFEITAHGHIPGETHEYDINSAYPHVARTLPCLKHGEWKHGRKATTIPNTPYVLLRAHIRGSDPYIGPMPYRRPNGSICRPWNTEGIYWQSEVQASERAGLVDTSDVREWWAYIPCDCPPPLAGLEKLYEIRKQTGKDTPLGKACKLIYNSVYGKFAQSIGGEYVQYGNAIYASLITSGCRSMILDAIAGHPRRSDACVMVATDGVYFTSPCPDLTKGSSLGAWEHKVKNNLALFKPGVYWDDRARNDIATGDSPRLKARGIDARSFGRSIESIDDSFSRWATEKFDGIWPNVTFPVSFSMVTCKQALRRGDWDSAGRIGRVNVTHTSDPIDKRNGLQYQGGIWRSCPHKYAIPDQPEKPSTPYAETFGWQYDPEENGVTPDGYVDDISREVLG